MAGKKKHLEAAIAAAETELVAARRAYDAADARLIAARRALEAAELALVQSERLSDVALAFLAQTAEPGGYSYYERSRFKATIRKLGSMGLVTCSHGSFRRVTVKATDAGLARLKAPKGEAVTP